MGEVSFGYSHYLKTYWYQGKLPSVKYGIYGGKLSKRGSNRTTLEHIQPFSQGGPTSECNLALATSKNNNTRGCKPLQEVLRYEDIVKYLRQFKDVLYGKLDGSRYIEKVLTTLANLGIDTSTIRKVL